jgi:hypothetical protein
METNKPEWQKTKRRTTMTTKSESALTEAELDAVVGGGAVETIVSIAKGVGTGVVLGVGAMMGLLGPDLILVGNGIKP